MSRARQIKSVLAAHRPPAAPAGETKALGEITHHWRDVLATLLAGIGAEAMALADADVDDLAVAMTELAEDLHTDSGLWRGLETGNTALFGTPLPLIWRKGDPPLGLLDARRFQFFLHTLWRHFKPDRIVSHSHRGFVAIASRAEAFFAEAFAGCSRASSVAAFLGTANERGWAVKRKLVWLGTHGFLFRFFYGDYLARQGTRKADAVGATDDFLCQECTAWSGFGALQTRGAEIETITAVNLINDLPYRIRMELPRGQCPFTPGQMVFGSLVPWRGEWHWSGAQQCYPQVSASVSEIKRSMIEKNAGIVYRYRSDLASRAREMAAEHHAAFVRFHGSDLAVFADGLTAAAAEQRHLREQIEAKTGAGFPAFLAKHGLDRSGLKLSWPQKLIECRRGVAVFYHEGEGVEIMADFDLLRAALGQSRTALSEDEAEVLQAFVESAAISPAFVRRVIREHGCAGLAALYYLPEGDDAAIEYLLRRFKGAFYRRRYPNLSLLGAE